MFIGLILTVEPNVWKAAVEEEQVPTKAMEGATCELKYTITHPIVLTLHSFSGHV
jgi:hypothetical protein